MFFGKQKLIDELRTALGVLRQERAALQQRNYELALQREREARVSESAKQAEAQTVELNKKLNAALSAKVADLKKLQDLLDRSVHVQCETSENLNKSLTTSADLRLQIMSMQEEAEQGEAAVFELMSMISHDTDLNAKNLRKIAGHLYELRSITEKARIAKAKQLDMLDLINGVLGMVREIEAQNVSISQNTNPTNVIESILRESAEAKNAAVVQGDGENHLVVSGAGGTVPNTGKADIEPVLVSCGADFAKQSDSPYFGSR